MKTPISHDFFWEEHFWKIWNRPDYEEIKAVTDPLNLFRDVYTRRTSSPERRGFGAGMPAAWQ